MLQSGRRSSRPVPAGSLETPGPEARQGHTHPAPVVATIPPRSVQTQTNQTCFSGLVMEVEWTWRGQHECEDCSVSLRTGIDPSPSSSQVAISPRCVGLIPFRLQRLSFRLEEPRIGFQVPTPKTGSCFTFTRYLRGKREAH